jgi:outer membrane protein assembly factor BamB
MSASDSNARTSIQAALGAVVHVGASTAVCAVNTMNGAVLWAHATGGYISGTPALKEDGSILYVGSGDGFLYALNATTGAVMRQFLRHFYIFSLNDRLRHPWCVLHCLTANSTCLMFANVHMPCSRQST